MTDIVERLRYIAQEFERTRPFDRALKSTMVEAADEILRLRSTLNEVLINGEWSEVRELAHRADLLYWVISSEVYAFAKDALK